MAKTPLSENSILHFTIDSDAYWQSLGIDTSVEHSEAFYIKAMREDMDSHWKEYTTSLLKESKEKILNNDDGLYISSLNRRLQKEEFDNIINKYPYHLQNTLRVYVESFEIPLETIPDPDEKKEKSRYGFWVADLEKIRNKCGKYLSSALVRAKRNFDNRHGQAWELTNHPLAIGKVLDSALEEVKIEADTVLKPKKIDVSGDKEHISSLRGIFD